MKNPSLYIKEQYTKRKFKLIYKKYFFLQKGPKWFLILTIVKRIVFLFIYSLKKSKNTSPLSQASNTCLKKNFVVVFRVTGKMFWSHATISNIWMWNVLFGVLRQFGTTWKVLKKYSKSLHPNARLKKSCLTYNFCFKIVTYPKVFNSLFT